MTVPRSAADRVARYVAATSDYDDWVSAVAAITPDPDDRAFLTTWPQYRSAKAHVDRHVRGRRVFLYRIMVLKPSAVQRLRSGANLGQSWSWRPLNPAAMHSWLNPATKRKSDRVAYLFRASASTADVDFVQTTALAAVYPHEANVRMLPGKTVEFDAVVPYELWRVDGEKTFGLDNERPDLAGRAMRAESDGRTRRSDLGE